MNLPGVDLGGAAGIFPGLEAELTAQARHVVAHRFTVFGIDVAFGPAIDWHLDPKTGRRWPLEFWGDIDYRDGTKIGGIKFAWELNRLYHLPLLALAHGVTREALYRRELFAQLASWLAANPYPKGINWISGIELGIRLVNLTYALMLLGADGVSAAERRIVFEFVQLHGRHLYRYPSRHSSCANHAIAEALGLYVAGASFPGMPEAADWKRRGRSTLEEQIPRQIHADGGSFEYSVPYLAFVVEHVLLYWLFSRHNGDTPGGPVEARLCAALELLSSLTDSRGNYPSIGDSDDGCVLKLLQEPHRNHLSLLNAGAVLFNKPQWLSHGAVYDLKTYCLLGADSHRRWGRLRESAPQRHTEARHFAESGWVVIRDRTHEALFVGNSSPLGLRPLGGHGHADALSSMALCPRPAFSRGSGHLSLSRRGRVASLFSRHRGPQHHPGGRSRIKHRSYPTSCSDDSMRSKRSAWRRRTESSFGPRGMMPIARSRDPVVHRRVVAYDAHQGCLTVEDTLQCQRRHAVECFFHFAPDCSVSVVQAVATVRSGDVQITLEMDPAWSSCRCVRGQTEPILGWYSPRFNEKTESCTIVCHKNIEQTAMFRTTIFL